MAEAACAVLLDLDGTLVDSHPALRAAYARFVETHGGTPSDEEFARWDGPPLREVVAGLRQAHAIQIDHAVLLDEYMKILHERYPAESRLAPGAVALLDFLEAERIPVAVVTSAPRRLARAVLEARGVSARLPVLVCGDDVSRGKPFPDAYLEGVRRLGVASRGAVAVEDSPAGVQAATSAGLLCVGLDARGERAERLALAGAHVLASGLDEAREILLALRDGPGRVLPARQLSARVAAAWPPPLPPETARGVDEIWRAARAARPRLEDGEIVALRRFARKEDTIAVEAALTRYRFFVAQRRGIPLGIRALGVSAVTLLARHGAPGALLLGRRGLDVTQYPGAWELCPSGGIDRRQLGEGGALDLEAQVREELFEELGVAAAQVRRISPLGLVEDLAERVVDLCFSIEVEADEAALRDHLLRHREYEQLAIVERAAPGAERRFLDERVAAGEALVPTVRPILSLLDRAIGRSAT